ncbi:MAG: DNA polymerase I [Ruminococcus sp.]|nr:DNA polymerase I [Ruminococcus sp.]
MKLLVLDGNSILNRAFYGIKLLTTKDGRYTNAIYGFMNILMKLEDEVTPDAVAVTFDLKAPTFRHKLYDGYKANRKGMPAELAEQMPVLKELLSALGYKIVTKEGFEADDIIGTLSAHIDTDDRCYIATGDRDSLQLVRENVQVLLASTKMGRAETNVYDIARIQAEYGVTPRQMIDIKALMGDSSDNIPGVAGIGKKTAEDLVQRFGSVDRIYADIETLDIKPGVRQKLLDGRDMAYLSYKLGTIDLDAPVDTNAAHYVKDTPNVQAATGILVSLEMFKILEKLNLQGEITAQATKQIEQKKLPVQTGPDALATVLLNGKTYFYFVNENTVYFQTETDLVVADLAEKAQKELFLSLLAKNDIEKYVYSAKEVFAYALKNGVTVKNVKMDITLAAYLLNPSAKEYDMHRLLQEYSPVTNAAEAEEELLSDCANLHSLCDKLTVRLEQNEQLPLLESIEIPLAEVLASMEQIGVLVDKAGIEQFNEMLTGKIAELQSRIYELAGEEFNINSPKQLGEILFVKLQIPTKKKTKTGFSTNAEVLEGLADEYEIVRCILDYRTLAKLKSTYCEGLLKVIADDGRIHSCFNQTETRTGRISSTEPNLQNIPVRQELGREMRKFFKAADGNLLVDADYSQIELRVLADIANDQAMIDAFNKDTDIHTVTASQVFHMPEKLVTPLMRSRAKAVNFGIVYGIGAFSLSKDIGVTRAEADRYIKDYLHLYAGVDRYMKEVVEQAKKDGYVKTLFARRRYLPELASSNGMLRAFGERVARNMPIQGTAADIIKIAMIRVYHRLKDENMQAKLILQVHDELIVEAPEAEAQKAAQIVSEEMENACKMKVRLKSDANIGKTWYDAKG